MQGSINLESEKGKGCKFEVKLPLQIPQKGSEQHELLLNNKICQSVAILFLTDKKKHFKNILQPLKCKISYSNTKEEILSKFKKTQNQKILVLIDNCSEKDNNLDRFNVIFEIREYEKKENKTQSIIILLVKSLQESERMESFVQNLKVEFMLRNFNQRQLFSVLNKYTEIVQKSHQQKTETQNEEEEKKEIENDQRSKIKKYILLAEDDFFQLNITQNLLILLDQTYILQAQSGLEAFQVYQKYYKEINVIFIDNDLGDFSGLEIISKIRQQESELKIQPEERVKIIMISGSSEDKLVQSVIEAGADAFYEKPFTKRQCEDVIKRYM